MTIVAQNCAFLMTIVAQNNTTNIELLISCFSYDNSSSKLTGHQRVRGFFFLSFSLKKNLKQTQYNNLNHVFTLFGTLTFNFNCIQEYPLKPSNQLQT
jgi:hypothetical protein